jgi:hypothetical protein
VTATRPVIRIARPGDASGIVRVEAETWRHAYESGQALRLAVEARNLKL